MYCDLINEKELTSFASFNLGYNGEVINNLHIQFKEKTDQMIFADLFLRNPDSTFSYLGQFAFDDYNFAFKMFILNSLNQEIMSKNGNEEVLSCSERWRLFLIRKLVKKFGSNKAEEYVKVFARHNKEAQNECNKLMQIVSKKAEREKGN